MLRENKGQTEFKTRSSKAALLEARTYRYMGHSMADPIHGHYRTKEELEEQKQKDPITHLHVQLQQAGMLSDEEWDEIVQRIEAEVEEAAEFAEKSPEPDPDALYANVYSD